jgi:Holliday junction resolvase-like predicted endonuclease
VVEKDSMMIFVEVKDVSSRDDISDYVTSKKIVTLRKAIDMYIWSMTYEGNYRLDIVFVSRGRIIEQFCDVIIDS